ncbi:hypothetical protein NDU88_000915 [Pleurodeles waltl]|uniref:Natural cytotoxicity triggering receptor 3 n=1 Tax=Pleurodeles waltl TaxID=8319 RepID=A0AAV7Q731_PLEWA|nr:hypothetical protein NDU88_000915 [Pleurodeles waltl]
MGASAVPGCLVPHRDSGEAAAWSLRPLQCCLVQLRALRFCGAVITVSQPRTTNVTAGDTATLQCSFNSSETTTIGGYKWFFINPSSTSVTEVTNMSEKFSGRVFIPKHTIFTSQRKANIDIHNMQHNDVGRYVCEVELFMINLKGRGNGTQLLVLEAPRIQGPGFPSSWMALYIGLGLACLLLPTIVLIVCMRKRRRGEDYLELPRQQDEFQDRLHYATLSIEEGNRRSRPCKASDQVVYSGVQTDDHPGVSKRPFQDPDHILYTRVNSVTGANEAHRSREKQESVVYARTPLSG